MPAKIVSEPSEVIGDNGEARSYVITREVAMPFRVEEGESLCGFKLK